MNNSTKTMHKLLDVPEQVIFKIRKKGTYKYLSGRGVNEMGEFFDSRDYARRSFSGRGKGLVSQKDTFEVVEFELVEKKTHSMYFKKDEQKE
jgi:hypothetical protein